MAISKAITASTNFFDIIGSDRVRSDGLSEPSVSAHGDIELRKITFAYPTRPNVKVLDDFSATFQSGKTTALVGPSGSGKSTIVGLLEQWYELDDISPMAQRMNLEAGEGGETAESSDVTEKSEGSNTGTGAVWTSGHNIQDFSLKWWRSQIGLVQQEPFLFNDSVESNVAFGLIGTIWEDAEPEKKLELVQDACRQAYADDFIRKLPKAGARIIVQALR